MMPCNTTPVSVQVAPSPPECVAGEAFTEVIMGLLDSVIGALSGVGATGGSGDMLHVVLDMLASDGDGPGVHGLIEAFERRGLAHLIGSWIAIGPNHAISPDVLRAVIGPETVARIAEDMGLSEWATSERLARMLPYVLDKLTPAGYVPPDGLGDLGELLGRIGRG
jgi:uncharacterized protein YidB (DUF937 family)